MATDDVDATVCRPLGRDREIERFLRDARNGERRRGDGDEGAYVDRAIVIVVLERRARRELMVRRAMHRPMGMDRTTRVMVRGMLVGMAVDERSPHGCDLQRQGKREGDDFPHDASLLDAANQKVKAS